VKTLRRCVYFGLIPVCLLVTVVARAQNPSQFKNWNPPANEVRVKPKLNCPDLRSLTGYEFSIITASAIAGTADVPEHCLVTGQILPKSDLRWTSQPPGIADSICSATAVMLEGSSSRLFRSNNEIRP